MQPILSIQDLESELSNPTPGVLDTLRSMQGDFMVLGAGGKMGPTLARMLRRGLDAIDQTERQVIAVSRFSSPSAAVRLQQYGVRTIACDLLDRAEVERLPFVPNVIFMAGQKFGTSEREKTWAMNTLVPANVAEHFSASRIVAFSTGCVYPLVQIDGPGAFETDPLGPPGDYSNSCVGRERIFTYFSKKNGTTVLLFRLCYAIDLRYGVLCDVANKVAQGMPVDLSMGAVNVIWQGDANARAIQCLAHTTSPPTPLNVTGLDRISIRWLAGRFGERFGIEPMFAGSESSTAWLWDASRSYELFGLVSVSLDEMIDATVTWIQLGGSTLGKPTHFEKANGQF